MRVAIIFLLAATIFAQAPVSVNVFDTCLRDLKVALHQSISSAEYGLQKNYLDMAKLLLESGADFIQTHEDCTQVQATDVLNWVGVHATAAQQACLMQGVSVLGNVTAAVHDMRAHASHEKIMADWANVMGALDGSVTACIPN